QTRQKESDVGTEIIVDNGAIADMRDCGCAPGTNIRVSFLFGNLPARKKFLKGANTEDSHIEETMLMLALSRPEISFELFMNERCVMQVTMANDLAARTMMLLGKDTFSSMLPVEYSEDNIHLYGFISKPGFTRNSRRDQRVIVNGRVASAETIYFAIRDAYYSLIVKGRYPSSVLYLDLDPERVDVNVHPAKREVRFREPQIISNVVSAGIRQALRKMPGGGEEESSVNQEINVIPTPQPFEAQPLQTSLPLNLPPNKDSNESIIQPEKLNDPALSSLSSLSERPVLTTPPVEPESFGALEKSQNSICAPPSSENPVFPKTQSLDPGASIETESGDSEMPSPLQSMQLKGRLGKNYLLVESRKGLVIVNIKAAMQRILFERMLRNMKKKEVEQQTLLIPVSVNLGPEESRILRSELQHFQQLGFTIEHFGGNSYIIAAVPAFISDQDIGQTINDIIDDLRHNRNIANRNSLHLAQMTSRYAVRLKENYSISEQKAIIHNLIRCEMPYICPNGEATMIHYSFSELEKRFKN
ncbi:MAG: DNA mismatch repair endonuclease MutL, partial [Parabacteroides sp.]